MHKIIHLNFLSIFALCGLSLCVFAPTCRAFVIRAPPTLAGRQINSPLVNPTIYSYHPAVGEIIDGDVVLGTSGCDMARVSGRILLLSNESTPGSPLQSIVYKAEQCGAIGVVFRDKVSDYAGLLGATRTAESELINITFVGISKIDGAFMVSALAEAAARNESVIIDLEGSDTDVNYWDLWGNIPLGAVLQGIMAIFCGIVSSVALSKLAALFRHSRATLLAVPQLVLFIRLISNWFRAIYWATDPMFLGRFFSFSTGQILLTISFPFEIVGNLVVAFYWQELLRNKHVLSTDILTYMKIPVVVISALLLLMEFTFAGLRAALFDLSVATIISTVAYIVVTLAACTYFLFIGIKVIMRLRGSKAMSVGQKNLALIRRTVLLVGLTALFSFLWCISLVLAIADEFLNNPFYFRSVIFVWFTLLEANSLVSVLSIRVRYTSTSYSSSLHRSDSATTSTGNLKTPVHSADVVVEPDA